MHTTIFKLGRNDIFIGVRPSFNAVIAGKLTETKTQPLIKNATRDPSEVAAMEVSEQITITQQKTFQIMTSVMVYRKFKIELRSIIND